MLLFSSLLLLCLLFLFLLLYHSFSFSTPFIFLGPFIPLHISSDTFVHPQKDFSCADLLTRKFHPQSEWGLPGPSSRVRKNVSFLYRWIITLQHLRIQNWLTLNVIFTIRNVNVRKAKDQTKTNQILNEHLRCARARAIGTEWKQGPVGFSLHNGRPGRKVKLQAR